jgi:hypothetical protein
VRVHLRQRRTKILQQLTRLVKTSHISFTIIRTEAQ